ncbi:MAG TPA: DUF177 domain-containing protein [Polyangiaceae bacterium]|jgi:uncharacterized protein
MNEREFAIPVRDLDAAGKPFRFPVRAAWLRGALEATEVVPGEQDGELDVRLSKSGTDVVVHGRVRASLLVPCARCLEPAKVALDEDVSVLVVPAAAMRGAAPSGEDDADEQADVIGYDGETVVLDDLVRDELLLAIPMIPLCSEGCPGIRPKLGPEEPARAALEGGLDPRLRPLLRLKKSST